MITEQQYEEAKTLIRTYHQQNADAIRTKVIFNIATVERRKKHFLNVLNSLANQSVQADKINVACSYGYDPEIRSFIDNNFVDDKIIMGNFTCEKKFFGFDSSDSNSYFLTFDDDIVYPLDYVKKLIEGIEKYKRQAIVGFHGSTFKRFPVVNFQKDRVLHQYFTNVGVDVKCNILGSGVMGFYVGTIKDAGFEFSMLGEGGNITDDVFSHFARSKEIDMIVLKHAAGWIKVMPDTQDDESTWKKDMIAGFERHLKLINS